MTVDRPAQRTCWIHSLRQVSARAQPVPVRACQSTPGWTAKHHTLTVNTIQQLKMFVSFKEKSKGRWSHANVYFNPNVSFDNPLRLHKLDIER
ncbi:hypothetical protein J6590_069896 [Homalodisca vitripennis]|nr:hypothetical protein J6590_069896 [Homalodisca vitripennis]